MARNDKETYESYPKDTFDNPPVGPVGVHRGSRSATVRVMPFIVAAVVAALLGYGAWGMFSGEFSRLMRPATSTAQSASDKTNQSAHNDSDQQSQSDDAGDDTASGTQNDTSSGASSDTSDTSSSHNNQATQDETTASEQPNKQTAIRVVNATSINGYAGQKAQTLQTAGYTNVTAANPSGSVPDDTVVWYQNETDKATASNVAATLGITNVQQMTNIAAPVVVVLLH